ncbi:hypothetical protein ES703_114541 [subsurface metagenome]
MKYRQFGSLDWKASVLGFGCMRFPRKIWGKEHIDEPIATRMLRQAIDSGVNYLDTAYVYHGGESELLLGRALKDGYRQKVKVATKVPVWDVQSYKDFDRFLNEQLKKLQDEHIELYLLHCLNKKEWEKVRKLEVFKWAEKAIADGRIGYLGFSFHDEFDVFKDIIDGWDKWTFCQIQYNYMNEEVQAGTEGLNYAAEKGLAVVVMEPLLGGSLAHAPEPVQKLWNSASKRRTPADWALQWLWNKPEVTLVLSGMSTMQQVEENLASADRSGVDTLTQEELDIIVRVRDVYEKLRPIPCTECRYCMPCPNGVDIPANLMMYNSGFMYNSMDLQRIEYSLWEEKSRASRCTQCLECEEKCPQNIKISEWMATIDQELRSAP